MAPKIDSSAFGAVMNSLKKAQTTKTLKELGPQVHVAEVVHHGSKLTVPEGMTIPDAIRLLETREAYLQQQTELIETYNVFPWDGANALQEVLTAEFGWAQGVTVPGLWFKPDSPPKMIAVEVEPGVTKKVPWGRFEIPGVDGYLETSMTIENDRFVFCIKAVILRVHEATVNKLLQAVREYLKDNSIYRGKALKIRFLDDDGDVRGIPEITLVDTSKTNTDMLIFSDDLSAQVSTNLFTPIERIADLKANNLPIKRGVLLAGTYGTGKTLAATVAAKKAVDNNLTFIYVPHADEMAMAVEFAKQYQQDTAAVVYCEDIDREIGSDERTVAIDDLLNIIDGIDTKHSNIIIILTTNDLESINSAMLRPGRLDAVIEVTPPDSVAVERLLRHYGDGLVLPETNLRAVGQVLDGQIPATIAEVVKRAKLTQIRLNAPGQPMTQLTAEALLESAKSMSKQIDLLDHKIKDSKNMKHINISEASLRTIKDSIVQGAVKTLTDLGQRENTVLSAD